MRRQLLERILSASVRPPMEDVWAGRVRRQRKGLPRFPAKTGSTANRLGTVTYVIDTMFTFAYA